MTRVNALTRGLQDLGMTGMSEGELQRRTDMVARVQDDCEKLGKMVVVARQTTTGLSSRSGGGGMSNASRNPAMDSDREALLGTSSPTIKPVARVFGRKSPPQETEETRPLDNVGVFGLQQMQIDTQDQQLSQLSSILLRQKHMAGAIGNELTLQNELLDGLIGEVDHTQGKMKGAQTQMNRLGK